MPTGSAHYFEYLTNEFERNIFMKQIAHRIDEDTSWFLPGKRQFQRARMHRKREPIPVMRISHLLKSFCKTLRVTIFASGADFGAAGEWIPGSFCPLNGRVGCHYV